MQCNVLAYIYINVIPFFLIFSGIPDSSAQSSDFNGNRNAKMFPYSRDGPYMPQLSESHEHQLYSNRYVSDIIYNLCYITKFLLIANYKYTYNMHCHCFK